MTSAWASSYDLAEHETYLYIFWVSEVARVKDWFIIRVLAPQHHPASRLGSEQHGNHWPGVTVGQGSVHLPHCVTDPVSLKNISWDLMKNICRWVERLLSHGMVMVQSWRINLNFQWFYSPLNMTKTHSSLVRISSLCTVSGSTTWSSSSTSFSLPFWSVFLHLKLDCLIQSGTLCQDSLDSCWWTWWTPTPDPVKY